MKRYPHNCGPIEYINSVPYQIVARYQITEVKDPQLIKEWLGCDTSFKVRNRDYWFCEEIKEADWEYV